MPSLTPKQHRFFLAVAAYRRGDLKDASDSVKRAAASIKPDDLRDFASRTETLRERRQRFRIKAAQQRLRRKPTPTAG